MTVRKRPFVIDEALAGIEKAIASYPKAAMFELADDGFTTLFQQLVACVISIRTRDELSVVIARNLFATASSPEAIHALSESEIEEIVRKSTFPSQKAKTIKAIAAKALVGSEGILPCDDAELQSLPGVGPKCSHLALGIACGQALISVDIHVHRVVNRWGVVHAVNPEATMRELEIWLPVRYRVTINRMLVPFGKHICTGVRPRCSVCPVHEMCGQVGVTSHR